MAIEFACPGCKKRLRVPDHSAGQLAVCPSCSKQFTVPELAPPINSSQVLPKVEPADGERADVVVPNHPGSAAGINPFVDSSNPAGEVNPYAAPAEVDDWQVSYFDEGQLRLASLGQRLGGRILDNLASIAPAFLIGLVAATAAPTANDVFWGGLAVCAFAVVPIINWVLITQNGRTLGKIAVGTQIVNEKTGQPPGFVSGVVLRTWLPLTVWFLGVGGLVSLIDSLFVFGEKRQCLHDLIAQTRVIEYRDSNTIVKESPFMSPFESQSSARPTLEEV